MDELVKAVSQKTGLSAEQSRQAADAVIDFLSTKLPAPVAQQVKGVLSGGGIPGMPDAAQGLGGMLGKK